MGQKTTALSARRFVLDVAPKETYAYRSKSATELRLLRDMPNGETVQHDTFRVSPSEPEVQYLRLPAGEYVAQILPVESTGAVISTQGPPELHGEQQHRFTVPRDNITLFPYVISTSSAARHLNEADQLRAATDLSDFVRFHRWAGGSFFGFGRYTTLLGRATDRFRLTVTTTPSGAELAVDAEPIGRTPITLQLPAGRYALDLSQEGHEPTRIITELISDAELQVELVESTDIAVPELTEYGLLLQRFATLVDGEDDLFSVPFGNSLQTMLAQDERIRVLTAGHEPSRSADQERVVLFQPDYAHAESIGAELILAGFYTTRGEELFVTAGLYDVRTRGIKTSTLLTGRAGLEIFDTVDEMTDALSQSVDRVLLARGQDTTGTAELLSEELSGRERRAVERDVVLRRHAQPHAVAASVGVGNAPSITRVNVGALEDERRRDGPTFLSGLTYTYQVRQTLGIYASFIPDFSTARDRGDRDASQDSALDLPFSIAPEFLYGSPSLDIYMRPGLEYRYALASNIRAPLSLDGEESEGTIETVEESLGPYSYLNGFLDTGVRLYTHQRFSDPITFVNFGLKLYLVSYETGTAFPTDVAALSENVMLYAGYGLRLGAKR
ncbi:MAG: PEGA domain-containing protein [Spirochaeta sp.]|nr:PEGA domain-containing protein [Spirochaeta sp.]